MRECAYLSAKVSFQNEIEVAFLAVDGRDFASSTRSRHIHLIASPPSPQSSKLIQDPGNASIGWASERKEFCKSRHPEFVPTLSLGGWGWKAKCIHPVGSIARVFRSVSFQLAKFLPSTVAFRSFLNTHFKLLPSACTFAVGLIHEAILLSKHAWAGVKGEGRDGGLGRGKLLGIGCGVGVPGRSGVGGLGDAGRIRGVGELYNNYITTI